MPKVEEADATGNAKSATGNAKSATEPKSMIKEVLTANDKAGSKHD